MTALFALAPIGCRFDLSGSSSDYGVQDGSVAGGGPVEPPKDPQGPGGAGDAGEGSAPPCVDADGDGFFVPTADASCGRVDCNDDNADVFPGQLVGFTVPDPVSGFDYDCDSLDTKLIVYDVGGACQLRFFGCAGTGWIGYEPECGARGTWHQCEGAFLACEETDRLDVLMPCR